MMMIRVVVDILVPPCQEPRSTYRACGHLETPEPAQRRRARGHGRASACEQPAADCPDIPMTVLHEGAAGPSRSGGMPALDILPAPVARYFEAVLPDAP